MEVPLASVVTLGIALVSAGAVFGKLMAMAEKIKGLERSREKLGERIGELEKQLALTRERQRSITGVQNIPRGLPPAGGGRVQKPVHDESGSGEEDTNG